MSTRLFDLGPHHWVNADSNEKLPRRAMFSVSHCSPAVKIQRSFNPVAHQFLRLEHNKMKADGHVERSIWDDVPAEGHAMQTSNSWPDSRKHLVGSQRDFWSFHALPNRFRYDASCRSVLPFSKLIQMIVSHEKIPLSDKCNDENSFCELWINRWFSNLLCWKDAVTD